MDGWMNEWMSTQDMAHTYSLCQAFRPFLIIPHSSIVSKFRDWLPRMVFSQRGWIIGFPLSCYVTANRYVRLPAAVRYGRKLSDSEWSSEFIEYTISCFCVFLGSCSVITYHHYHHHHQ